jgi:hypothetical protein
MASSSVHRMVFFSGSSEVPPTAAPDTNILLLVLVAQTDVSLLKTFKRVQNFTSEDIELLREVLRPFQRLATTPHVLAETSNFLDQAPQYRRVSLTDALRNFIRSHTEFYEESRLLAERDEFAELGLSDAGLSSLSNEFTIITMDFHLAGKIRQSGGSVINFQQLRSQRIRPSV